MDISPSKCLTFLPTGLLCPDSVPMSSDCDCVFSWGNDTVRQHMEFQPKSCLTRMLQRGAGGRRPRRNLPRMSRSGVRNIVHLDASRPDTAIPGAVRPHTQASASSPRSGAPARQTGANPLLCPRFLSAMRSKPLRARAPWSARKQRTYGRSSRVHMRIGCAHADRLFTCG